MFFAASDCNYCKSMCACAFALYFALEKWSSPSRNTWRDTTHQTLRWLCIGAVQLAASNISANASRAFLLDASRTGSVRDFGPEVFDNRWKRFPRIFRQPNFCWTTECAEFFWSRTRLPNRRKIWPTCFSAKKARGPLHLRISRWVRAACGWEAFGPGVKIGCACLPGPKDMCGVCEVRGLSRRGGRRRPLRPDPARERKTQGTDR